MRCVRALAFGGVVMALVAVQAPASAQTATPSVRFADAAIHGVEGRGQVQVVVERTDLPVSRLLVQYRTEDGPFEPSARALAGTDYVHAAGTLVFEVGVRSASFSVMVRDDDVVERTEHLLLELQLSGGGGASSRLTLLDDDLSSTSPSVETGAASASPVTAPPARSSGGATPAPAAPPPVVVASSAGVRRPVVVRTRPRAAAVARRPEASRRIVLQQTPSTPFELRPVPGSSTATGVATAVDPLLALAAGLLLARVAAEVWFRARITAA